MAYTTINNPELFFQTKLYTGTGSSHAITLDGSEDMQPDMVWWKERTSTDYHTIVDSVRGATKRIFTNVTEAEDTNAESLKSFDSDGFTMGTNAGANQSSQTYVAWNWKMNGSGSSNTEGSLNTTANSVNTTAGQAIISYTGNGTDGATIGHGLDTAPDVLLLKDRDNTRNWRVLHTGYGDASKNCLLNSNAAIATRADDFNSTYPSSTLITLGGDAAVNGNTTKYIIYAFSSVKGYSKHGSYTGNGNTDGAFIYLGFRPAWVVVKRTDAAENWVLFDNKLRPANNVGNGYMYPDLANVEDTSADFDMLSNGFKTRTASNIMNGSGSEYIYIAFAESPLVNSNGVPATAR